MADKVHRVIIPRTRLYIVKGHNIGAAPLFLCEGQHRETAHCILYNTDAGVVVYIYVPLPL